MLEQLKEELKIKLQQSLEDKNLSLLYNTQVKVLFEAILNARSIDDMAVQVNLNLINELFKHHRYKIASELIDNLLANRELLTKEELLDVLDKKGITLLYTGKYEQAGEIFKELIDSDIAEIRCKGLANLGITYYYLTVFAGKKLLNEANDLFLKAQKMVKPEAREERFKITFNLAHVYYEKGKFDEALEYLEKSLSLADFSPFKAMVYTEIARIYIIKQKLDLAKDYLDMAERILLKRSNYHELALARNMYIRGIWLKKKGEYSNSINFFELALDTFIDMELFSEAAEVSYELYVLYKFLGRDDAEEYLADYQYYSRMIS